MGSSITSMRVLWKKIFGFSATQIHKVGELYLNQKSKKDNSLGSAQIHKGVNYTRTKNPKKITARLPELKF